MGTELAGLEERIANTASGAITSIQAVYVPADDFTDPGRGAYVLASFPLPSCCRVTGPARGLFPAIDALQSNSKMGHARHCGRTALRPCPRKSAEPWAQYEELKDIIAMLGLEQLSSEDRKVVARGAAAGAIPYPSPFFATEQFQRTQGKDREPERLARWL